MLLHYLGIVDRDEFLHVCKCSVSCSDCVAIEERPERVAGRITLVQGSKHPLDDAARDPIIPGRIVPEFPASAIAWSPGPVQLGHINLFILQLVFISSFV